MLILLSSGFNLNILGLIYYEFCYWLIHYVNVSLLVHISIIYIHAHTKCMFSFQHMQTSSYAHQYSFYYPQLLGTQYLAEE